MLEVLSANRKLEQLVEEEEQMLSQVEQTRLPSFSIAMRQEIRDAIMQEGFQEGMLQGLVLGKKRGQRKVLLQLLRRRFDELPLRLIVELSVGSEEDFERWCDNILTAKTIDEVFE